MSVPMIIEKQLIQLTVLHFAVILVPEPPQVLVLAAKYLLPRGFFWGHDKMWSGADLQGGSPSVSCNHVIDPHFVTFSSSFYTTVHNPNQP